MKYWRKNILHDLIFIKSSIKMIAIIPVSYLWNQFFTNALQPVHLKFHCHFMHKGSKKVHTITYEMAIYKSTLWIWHAWNGIKCEWEKESTILKWSGKCQYANETSVKSRFVFAVIVWQSDKFLLFFHVPRVNLTFIFPAFFTAPLNELKISLTAAAAIKQIEY